MQSELILEHNKHSGNSSSPRVQDLGLSRPSGDLLTHFYQGPFWGGPLRTGNEQRNQGGLDRTRAN